MKKSCGGIRNAAGDQALEKVRPQNGARNPAHPLDFNHPIRRDFVPLVESLPLDPQLFSKLGKAPAGFSGQSHSILCWFGGHDAKVSGAYLFVKHFLP